MMETEQSYSRSCILWLEDRWESVANYQKLLQNKHIHIHKASTVSSLQEELVNSCSLPCSLKGIILDIQLLQMKNMNDLQQGLVSHDGSEAGWLVLEYLRRPENNLRHVPVLILTVQNLNQQNRQRLLQFQNQYAVGDVGPVEFMEKFYDLSKGLADWIDRLTATRGGA